jgi:hypothetical protein
VLVCRSELADCLLVRPAGGNLVDLWRRVARVAPPEQQVAQFHPRVTEKHRLPVEDSCECRLFGPREDVPPA